jgi:hypothetical protein
LRQKPGKGSILLKIAEVQIAMHALQPARRTLKLAASGSSFGREQQQEYSRLEILLKSEQDSKGGFGEG